MKAIPFIPPILALLVVSTWIGSGRRTLSKMEEESAVLRGYLDARASAPAADEPSAGPESSARITKEKERIDWKTLAGQVLEMKKGGGVSDMRSMLRLQQRLQAMSAGDLAAALDEIAGLDLPVESRLMLEQMLIGPLCNKDPELALTRYVDRIDDNRGGMSWQLSNAMKEWAEKDPLGATTWMDRQITAGTFDSKSLDGKSGPRMRFEGVLVASLLSTDPLGAAERLEEFPDDQRRDILRNHAGNAVKEEDQLAYANLVRTELSDGNQASTLAQQASRLAWKDGYGKITEYLDRIEATPSERAASVSEAVETKFRHLSDDKTITRDDIEIMREWATGQAPDVTESSTGKALGLATQSDHPLEFSEAAELAVSYHDASGGDEVLVEFLNNTDRGTNKEAVRELAGKISDPKSRERILKRFNLKADQP